MNPIDRIPSSREIPGKAKFGGYIYAIGFDNEAIKVGATANPTKRIATHRKTAGSFGLAVVAHWVSPLHEDPYETEKKLIGLALKRGSLAAGREYFTGIDFADLVRAAQRLPFRRVDTKAHEAREEAERERFRKTGGIFGLVSVADPPLSHTDRLSQAIAPFFGAMPDGTYRMSEKGTEAVPVELLEEMATLTGRDVDDFCRMDFIDLLEHAVTSTVRTEALRLRGYALENGRGDLLAPMRPSGPISPPPEIDPSDTNKLALYHFRDRVSHYLELHVSDYDNPDPDPDPVDWATVIMQEAAVLHDRGPGGYLHYISELDPPGGAA